MRVQPGEGVATDRLRLDHCDVDARCAQALGHEESHWTAARHDRLLAPVLEGEPRRIERGRPRVDEDGRASGAECIRHVDERVA